MPNTKQLFEKINNGADPHTAITEAVTGRVDEQSTETVEGYVKNVEENQTMMSEEGDYNLVLSDEPNGGQEIFRGSFNERVVDSLALHDARTSGLLIRIHYVPKTGMMDKGPDYNKVTKAEVIG